MCEEVNYSSVQVPINIRVKTENIYIQIKFLPRQYKDIVTKLKKDEIEAEIMVEE